MSAPAGPRRAPVTERAGAKVNLCLFLGPVRGDGRHELVTVFDTVSLADELEVRPAKADSVTCEGVAGSNLVGDALAALRAAGWAGPPVAVRIAKRIPIAAGMGGGSADAAAMLRVAPRLAPLPAGAAAAIAAGLGADVPGQLAPGPSLGTGAGERLEPLRDLPPYGVLVLPQQFALPTADVYREADRMGLGRSAAELGALRRELAELAAAPRDPAGGLPPPLPARLIVNDLQPAALSLAPEIARALEAAREAGADHALVCGSGPTVIGLYRGPDGERRAAAAAGRLQPRYPGAVAAGPVRAGVLPGTANE